MLGSEQHGQHVVNRRQVETSVIGIKEREISKMPVRVGDEAAESEHHAHLVQRLQFDVAIPVQTAGRRDPVIQAAIQAGVDREQRSDANAAGGAFAIETIHFEVGAVKRLIKNRY
jgi:hypothetical protein